MSQQAARKSSTRWRKQASRVSIVGGQRAVGPQVLRNRGTRRARRADRPSTTISRAASRSPSPAKNSSASIPWTCTGTPSGQGPKAHSPVTGTQHRRGPRRRHRVASGQGVGPPSPRRRSPRRRPLAAARGCLVGERAEVGMPVAVGERGTLARSTRRCGRRRGPERTRCARHCAARPRTPPPRPSDPGCGGTATPRPSTSLLPTASSRADTATTAPTASSQTRSADVRRSL